MPQPDAEATRPAARGEPTDDAFDRDPGALARAVAFLTGVEDRSATRLEPFASGVAVFNQDFLHSYRHNFLRVRGGAETVTAAGLAAAADRLQGRAGLAHRMIYVNDEAAGAELRPGFEAIGWLVERQVVMVRGRPPDRRPDPGTAAAVREVDWPTLRPATEASVRREPYATSEEVIRQLVDRKNVTARATHLRHFAAFADGSIASMADLYSDGRTAMIEEVGTLEEHRGRGFARAVVLRAAQEAERAGHDFVFLLADDFGWTKTLYAKLGFDPVGKTYEFSLRPTD